MSISGVSPTASLAAAAQLQKGSQTATSAAAATGPATTGKREPTGMHKHIPIDKVSPQPATTAAMSSGGVDEVA